MGAKTILIVDDEFPARKRIRRMIDSMNEFEVCGEARNGQEGLRMVREMKPDILLTDIEMPVMDGLEMIRKIREEDPGQIIIILSCYESFAFAQQAIRCNVQDYLIKDMTQESQLRESLRLRCRHPTRICSFPPARSVRACSRAFSKRRRRTSK